VTALHVSPASGDLLVRGYNLTDVPQTVAISYRGALPTDVVDFLEHPLPAKPADPLRPAEIRTYRFRKD
jgi:alpha-mannosidase